MIHYEKLRSNVLLFISFPIYHAIIRVYCTSGPTIWSTDMSKESIWKRFGGWISRSHQPAEGTDVMRLDAEGRLVGDDTAGLAETEAPLTARQATQQQLEAIEEGFNKLVDVLGNVNESVAGQRQQSLTLQESLRDLPDIMRHFPHAVKAQGEIVEKLTEELRDQNVQYEQLREAIKVLPTWTEHQVEKLTEINEQLAATGQTESQMLENLQAQSHSVANMGTHLQKHNEQVQEALTRQQRQFTRLFVAAIVISLTALAVVTAILIMNKS